MLRVARRMVNGKVIGYFSGVSFFCLSWLGVFGVVFYFDGLFKAFRFKVFWVLLCRYFDVASVSS